MELPLPSFSEVKDPDPADRENSRSFTSSVAPPPSPGVSTAFPVLLHLLEDDTFVGNITAKSAPTNEAL